MPCEFGKKIFAKLIDIVLMCEFHKCVNRYIRFVSNGKCAMNVVHFYIDALLARS